MSNLATDGISTLRLAAGDYELQLNPNIGGSVASLTWRGLDLFRRATGGSVLDAGCFPLVPFCNRIENGTFQFDGRTICMPPNMPGSDHPHTLHGFGWTSAWTIADREESHARIVQKHDAGTWPWDYVAEQSYALDAEQVTMALAVTNLSESPMPCGLGFHPYFPRAGATYLGLHHAEWDSSADGLPVKLQQSDAAKDWWGGKPVAAREIDTVYAGRSGPLTITWPAKNLRLEILPSDELGHTAVFVPADTDYFCVEPMSQQTDALNRARHQMKLIPPGGQLAVVMTLRATTL